MYTEEQEKKYANETREIQSEEDLFLLLERHMNDSDFLQRLEFTMNDLLDVISRQYYKYTKEILENSNDIKIYLKVCNYIKGEEFPYYRAVASFFLGMNEKCLELLRIDSKDLFSNRKNNAFNDKELAANYIVPFKNAFKGFWNEILQILKSERVEKGVLELCNVIQEVYESDDNGSIQRKLEEVLAINPNATVVREFLGYTYYCESMWGNAVAMFEQIDESYVFFIDDLFFMMAWCYGKIGEVIHEIEYYQKSYEIYPSGFCTLNNLGYAYYKAKQYNKALEAFKTCIDKELSLKYATNNYVRTLIAMKRYKDAKAFAKNSPVKISKGFLDKLKKVENTNQRIKQDDPLESIVDEFSNDLSVNNKEIDLGIKRQQFSSEKLLEDELTMRIESGMEVFGKNLKIYRRKGIYGRQFILSNGRRLDLLCEDDNGELYVIELKKDSGYDDAYIQIAEYLEWFEKNWKDHKKVWGIICLNNPTQELLDKVHSDERIRVFEYQISYTEK